jgi:KDO2-lipid IV(A) lauroyltransferase
MANLPIFIYRESLGEHRAVIHPSFYSDDGGDNEQAVAGLTPRCASTIEAAITVAPDPWLWVHNRWRTRPAQSGEAQT